MACKMCGVEDHYLVGDIMKIGKDSNAYIMKNTGEKNKYKLVSNVAFGSASLICDVPITHCPWCGRNLEGV